jgi:6-phosphofructokinase 1
MIKNALYAQSGGVTPVINAQAAAVIETAGQYPQQIGQIFAGLNGIIGVLREELIDLTKEPASNIQGLNHTPAGAFGSCRFKLKSIEQSQAQYQRLLEVFKAHNIGYFFYNGGGDSQDTTNKIAQYCKQMNYPVTCIGIPKTIDNDLPITDNCPGFGSVAKYVAVSILEAGLDVASMAASSTKVFIMEVMGRHTGWIAAAGGLAAQQANQAPHIILFPEVAFDAEKFCAKVKQCVQEYGFCAIVAAEGIRTADGNFVTAANGKDMFGHAQLGGVAPYLANLVQQKLGLKHHWAVCDYLQRAARHIASQTDLEHARATGRAAVEFALAGKNAVMTTIVRESNNPYKWHVGEAALEAVANTEKYLPKEFISADGFGITNACREYLLPLIAGEAYPPYKNGLPAYVRTQNNLVAKKLDVYAIAD